MAGSRERLLYDRRSDLEYEYERRRRYENRYESRQDRSENRLRYDRYRIERPRRNGYVYEDIYSDFDEAQGRLSLFRPIRPEYLNLPNTYTKYNSLPRNYYKERRYRKDYYDFRIEESPREYYYERKRTEFTSRPKNVAVCKPLRLPEQNVRYWTTDVPKEKKRREETKKIVKFSEVSGCQKMVVDDPICGKKTVAARELEVSLDQMIQNGYFEKHNIPILKERKDEIVGAVPNGKCLTGEPPKPVSRKSRHLPQVCYLVQLLNLY